MVTGILAGHICGCIQTYYTVIYYTVTIQLRTNTPFRPHPSCLGKINKGIREYKSPTPVKLYIHFTFIEDLQ